MATTLADRTSKAALTRVRALVKELRTEADALEVDAAAMYGRALLPDRANDPETFARIQGHKRTKATELRAMADRIDAAIRGPQ